MTGCTLQGVGRDKNKWPTVGAPDVCIMGPVRPVQRASCVLCVWGGGERGCAGGPRSGRATHSQEGGLLVRSDIVRPGPPLWPDPMIPRESPARCYWRACEAPGASHIPRGRSPRREGSLFGACVPVSCSSGTTRNFYFLFSISFSLLPWRLVFVSFPPPEVTRVQHHKESHPP